MHIERNTLTMRLSPSPSTRSRGGLCYRHKPHGRTDWGSICSTATLMLRGDTGRLLLVLVAAAAVGLSEPLVLGVARGKWSRQ